MLHPALPVIITIMACINNFVRRELKRKHQSPSVHMGRLGSFSYFRTEERVCIIPLPNTHIYKIVISVISAGSQIKPARPEAIFV